MASNPWHPRVAPFFVYIIGLTLTGLVTGETIHTPALYLPVYVIVCVVIAAMLWRYRKLTPELNVRFHWSVIPSAVFLTAAWVALGYGYNQLFHGELLKQPLDDEATVPFAALHAQSAALFWVTFAVRGLGMSIVVPLFEELFTRSAMLRGLHRWRLTKTGLIQLAADMPLLGDVIAEHPAVVKAHGEPPALTTQLSQTPLGRVTVFATAASTLVFMASHGTRDWAGCVACGVVWCVMVGWTNRASLPPEKRLGLGPVVWSHGLVNALLWGFTIYTNDWQFL